MNICILNDNFSMGGQQKVTAMIGSELGNFYPTYLYSFYPTKVFYQDYKDIVHIDSSNSDINFLGKVRRKLRRFLTNNSEYIHEIGYERRLNNLYQFLIEKKINLLILNAGFLTAFAPAIKREFPNLKIIAWQHNTAEIYLEKYYNKILPDYTRGLESSDVVVCLTQHDKKIFSLFNKNTIVIQNPVEINKNINKCSDLKEKKIAFSSRYSIEQKGLDFLVEIAQKIPHNWKICFAGDGDTKQKRDFNDLLKKKRVENKFELLGSLDNRDMKKLYMDTSLFISTSRWEGFGLSIVEAMSYGLPIVSFSNYGPSEILENGKYGILIENYDLDLYTEKINELISNEKLMLYYKNKSLERSRYFSPTNIVEYWLQMIDKLIKG